MSHLDLFERASELAYRSCLPHVSIDCAVFGFHESSLKVLLLKMKGFDKWGLPGGYVKKDENLDAAAYRILKARTGASNIYLEQFRVFGQTGRSEHELAHWPEHLWQKQRFISTGYYALVDYTTIIPVVDRISEQCEWKDIDDLPDLMMDHQDILHSALTALRRNIHYSPIGLNLLPKAFTMPQLQKLYELILGKKLHRGNFQRKMHGFDILVKEDIVPVKTSHRPPIYYSFDIEKYNNALKYGLRQEW
ncbi:NUDIX domain-containing protein [Mucilaginibacter yixingensis]|uniref:NUDIX domain-containing protein n=1 Tax=Mucilaginibacter yixingensis TaxID=1295612 RepID=A0A2T5JGL4_9SPHI|nr:NUDIX domain-containing protein [Mucilaginibacter yixingensis]PTR01496.1 NUDIX domain-containing protein [Mucilaginibacter yixingensis]